MKSQTTPNTSPSSPRNNSRGRDGSSSNSSSNDQSSTVILKATTASGGGGNGGNGSSGGTDIRDKSPLTPNTKRATYIEYLLSKKKERTYNIHKMPLSEELIEQYLETLSTNKYDAVVFPGQASSEDRRRVHECAGRKGFMSCSYFESSNQEKPRVVVERSSRLYECDAFDDPEVFDSVKDEIVGGADNGLSSAGGKPIRRSISQAKISHINSGRWTVAEAEAWYSELPYLIGCNFIPAYAINQLEMWSAATFNLEAIEIELDLASSLNFNVVRVYLHDLLWTHERSSFIERIKLFLDAAYRRNIKVILVLFDDCHRHESQWGLQRQPVVGVHNSGWVMSPGKSEVLRVNKLGDNPQFDPSTDANLEVLRKFVVGILNEFKSDKRVLMWDIYNEPGQNGLNDQSNYLLTLVWKWARSVRPSQPLTSCIDGSIGMLVQRTNAIYSDILTFHSYEEPERLNKLIEKHKRNSLGRPVICTEFMAREFKSTFSDCVPVFYRSSVACICWGLVAGKSQTIYNWKSVDDLDKKLSENLYTDFPITPLVEPDLWFHDIFRVDGTPFDQKEVDFLVKFADDILMDL